VPFALLGISLLTVEPAHSYPSQSLQDKSVDVASDTKVERPVKIYHVGGDVKAPRKISSPVPVMDSAEDKTAGKQSVEPGSTILRIVVGEDGSVRRVDVAKSLKHYYDAKAIDAVRQWKFEPATKKGKPVAVERSCRQLPHVQIIPSNGYHASRASR